MEPEKHEIRIPIEMHHKTVTDGGFRFIKHNGTRLGVTTWLLRVHHISIFRFLSLESSSAWEKETSRGDSKTLKTVHGLVDVTRYLILPWTWIRSVLTNMTLHNSPDRRQTH